ncbi:MAG: hypothetical protein K0R61_4530 [Microvirga sp.]|jgi:hypothetical protein|nr:hypothetical protein [Microvirga sp.]MCD6070536.1 hypothetical protein [Microvirga sp.]MDF2687708.1 hypothetical protein [Microvirga sp.]MDF2974080.1 hypothetical protein [Microvirga sp.]
MSQRRGSPEKARNDEEVVESGSALDNPPELLYRRGLNLKQDAEIQRVRGLP